jgi:methionyl-tRNA synthetase
MSKRTLVTAALPYAHGRVHLGHLVEYIQADIYVRALKRLGTDALYICAADAHGTPIELAARKQGIPPEELVERAREQQLVDFSRFDIEFDHFSSTHSPTNEEIVRGAYETLRDAGALYSRDVEGNWCEHDERFLPDRFVKGRCPKCDAPDQYGDVCEICGHTYAPTDLKDPYCAICGNPPVKRTSEHLFFKLSDPDNVAFLRSWIDSGSLQPDVANYVRTWVETGLQDWDISRDPPYFGFEIPDKPNKFFYVWVDAPFGYAASSAEWGEKNGVPYAELWRSDDTRVEHVIGKDIVYFHTLFWPAVLHATGYTLPSRVQVHGMLTVNGEKMSKSRGTFINASVFAEHMDSQALRYFYACKLSAASDDLDLSLDDLVTRVNAELVNKHANLFSRALQFLSSKLGGTLGDLPFSAEEAQGRAPGDGSLLDLACQVVAACRRAEEAYRRFEFSQVMRELSAVADIGNEYVQAREPWTQIKSDPEAARETCTFAANVCYALATHLWPVVPRFAEAAARVLAADIGRMDAGNLFGLRNREIGPFERLYERVDKKAADAMVEASKDSLAAKTDDAPGDSDAEPITIDDFTKLDLRVGVVKEAKRVEKSKKLLQLRVDLGEPELRQVVAGIAGHYSPDCMVGKQVIVVANLKAAKLMGVESRGMVLAAHSTDNLAVLSPDKETPAGSKVS